MVPRRERYSKERGNSERGIRNEEQPPIRGARPRRRHRRHSSHCLPRDVTEPTYLNSFLLRPQISSDMRVSWEARNSNIVKDGTLLAEGRQAMRQGVASLADVSGLHRRRLTPSRGGRRKENALKSEALCQSEDLSFRCRKMVSANGRASGGAACAAPCTRSVGCARGSR